MKKSFKKSIVTIVAAGLMAVSLLACGGSDESKKETTTAKTESNTNTASNDGYAFTVNGKSVYINEDMETVLADLGKEQSYFESESCAFQGLDKTYTYASYVICTYPKDSKDYVLSINLKDDLVETAEGIAIGASKDDVVAKYSDAEVSDTAVIASKGSMKINFVLENDKVTGITYISK